MIVFLQWLLKLLIAWFAPATPSTKELSTPPAPAPVVIPDARDELKVDVVLERDKAVEDVRAEQRKTLPLTNDLDALVAHAKNVGKTTIIVFAASLALASQARSARADDFPTPTPIDAEPHGEDVMLPIRKGAVAPIEGVIFDAQTLLRWSNWRSQAARFRVIDLDTAKRWCSVETTHLTKERDAEHEARVADVAGLRKDLAKATEPRAWWDYPAVGFLSGVLIAGVFIALGEGLKR